MFIYEAHKLGCKTVGFTQHLEKGTVKHLLVLHSQLSVVKVNKINDLHTYILGTDRKQKLFDDGVLSLVRLLCEICREEFDDLRLQKATVKDSYEIVVDYRASLCIFPFIIQTDKGKELIAHYIGMYQLQHRIHNDLLRSVALGRVKLYEPCKYILWNSYMRQRISLERTVHV